MVVHKAWVPALGTWSLGQTSDPFNPEDGRLAFDTRAPADAPSAAVDDEKHEAVDLHATPTPALNDLLDYSALCNLAAVFREQRQPDGLFLDKHASAYGEGSPPWAATGDPTEMYVQRSCMPPINANT